jgi:hypothetical protein
MSYIGYEQLGKLNFDFEAIKDAFDGDLLENAAKQGSLFIELGVTNPTLSASGVEASIGAEGYNNESPPKFYKKVGENDTDWEQILTSTGGEFVANIELADATGQVLGNNILGQVNGRLSVGDGVTTGGNQFVIKHNDGEKFTLGDWNWTFADGVGVLDTAPDASATALVIPAVWFPQSIDDSLFRDVSAWTSLVMPNSVTTIGSNAFNYCSGLTGNLTIPNSVTSIGSNAFYYCSGFTGDLTIPDSVTTIGENAFGRCSGLTGNLTIPDSVTSIGSYAFQYCTGLTGNLTIPNSVTTIGSNAFNYCSGLTGDLTIPDSVTSIENAAFTGCTGFTGNLTIPNSVTTIGNFAFNYCTDFTGNLTIPNSVTSIGSNAFDSCSGFTGNLTIGNSVTTIGNFAFNYCTSLTGDLTIPDSVTSIGVNAFNYCTSLTGDLTIPDSVTSIGANAFSDCTGLTNVNCYVTKTIIDAGTDCFSGTSITTLHARSDDATWTEGSQTIGGKTGITVIKDL